MSFVQPDGIVGRSGLRSRKALALFVVLVLSGGAFLFAAGEAHAQQRPTPNVHATVTGPERAPVSARGLAKPTTKTLPAGASPSQVGDRDAGSSYSAEPDLVMSNAPEPALELLEEHYPASWVDLLPQAAMSESFGAPFVFDPAYDPALALLDPGLVVPGPWYPVPFVDPPPAPGPAGFGPALPYPGLTPEPTWGPVVPEAYKPLSFRIEEMPPVPSPAGKPEGVRSAPRQGNGVAQAVPVAPLPPFADRKAPPPASVPQEPPMPPPVTGPSREASLLLSSVEVAANSAVETLHGAAADFSEALVPGDEASSGLPSGGVTESPEDTPLPPSPAPLGGGYFSPLAGGQVNPGGVVPLLICVLATGLILLRPLVGRLSWASWEFPKPSLVLLLPLERPG